MKHTLARQGLVKRYGLAALAVLQTGAGAAVVVPSGYGYLTGPHSSYPDSGGELINGVAATVAWGAGPIGFGDVVPLAGWQLSNPWIEFQFAAPVTLGEVTVWAADSDSAAGVALPAAITISTPDLGFSKSLNVTNPPGAGYTVPLTLSGFSVTTDRLRVLVNRDPANSWTMLSEVQFQTVPEPGPAGLAVLGLLALACRRSRPA